jgi:hypothetical protein
MKFMHCNIAFFIPSFGMHKKTPEPNIGAVSIGIATHIKLSNVVAALTFFYWIWG